MRHAALLHPSPHVGRTRLGRAARDLTPDAIIAAATVAGVSTLPLLGALRRRCCPDSKIIVFAARHDPAQSRAPADVDIAAYLLWSDLSRTLLYHALATVLAGDIFVGSRAVAGFHGAVPRGPEVAGISARERAVLGWLAAGLSHEQIARAEGVSPTTVKRRIAALRKKLDAPTLFLLGARAARRGLVR